MNEYVVIADDSPPNRMILALHLKRLGFKVLECDDGQIAWNTLNRNRDQNIVAVMADNAMPHMNGVELLRRVRSDKQYANTPFISILALSEADSIGEIRKQNAQGGILKPVTFKRVSLKVQEYFPTKKQSHAA